VINDDRALSCTVIEIGGLKDIGGHEFDLLGHVTSSITWPLNPPTLNTLPQNQTRSGSDVRLLRYIHLKMPISIDAL